MPSGTLVAASLILSLALAPAAARVVHTDHAEVELVSQLAAAAPGDSFRVALRLVPEDGWYVYWSNPGDAGMAPSLDWDLPHGFSAGELEFTAPERIEHPPFASFGYTAEVWYPLWMHVAPDATPGTHELTARAEWLICSDECIPERAQLTLVVDVGAMRPEADRAQAWENVLARMPVEAPDWSWYVVYSDNAVQLRWTFPPDHSIPDRIAFFPTEQGIIENGAPQHLDVEGNRAILTLERDPLMLAQPGVVEGVFTAEPGWTLPNGDIVPAIFVAAPTEAPYTGGMAGGMRSTTLLAALSIVVGLLLILILMLRAKNEERKNA